jgi:membrane-bound ClpP family serine protease
MNTFGGRLDTATDIVNALNQTKIPTYTFINTNAGSAGSTYRHCHTAHLHGAGERTGTAPILPDGEDLPPRKGENDFRICAAHPWFRDEERAQSGRR